MKKYLKKIYLTLFSTIVNLVKDSVEILLWKLNHKKTLTPHKIKQSHISQTAQKYNLKILVETGTYRGDMVYAQLKNFETIYSIELDKSLWAKAVIRFNNYKNVQILNGDSGKVLSEVVPKLDFKSLFWLDGHYSGGITAKGELNCPIFEELSNILNSSLNHFIIIDDARLFIGLDDYPTIEELKKYVINLKQNASLFVLDDLIFIQPGEKA
jgi:hypothetical protein